MLARSSRKGAVGGWVRPLAGALGQRPSIAGRLRRADRESAFRVAGPLTEVTHSWRLRASGPKRPGLRLSYKTSFAGVAGGGVAPSGRPHHLLGHRHEELKCGWAFRAQGWHALRRSLVARRQRVQAVVR